MGTLTTSTFSRFGNPTSMTFNVQDTIFGGGELGDWTNAIEAVLSSLGVNAVHKAEVEQILGAVSPATSVLANRGSKWLFRFRDSTTGNTYDHEIGCADLNDLPAPDSDFLDLTAGVGLALKAAADAIWESPVGNSGTLESVKHVNRGIQD